FYRGPYSGRSSNCRIRWVGRGIQIASIAQFPGSGKLFPHRGNSTVLPAVGNWIVELRGMRPTDRVPIERFYNLVGHRTSGSRVDFAWSNCADYVLGCAGHRVGGVAVCRIGIWATDAELMDGAAAMDDLRELM